MLLLSRLNHRTATLIRLLGLVAISWTVFASDHPPGTSGRGLVVSISYALSTIAWLIWTAQPKDETLATATHYVMAVAGAVLLGAAPSSAASAFVFVAAVSAGVREPLAQASLVTLCAILALAVSVLLYDGSGLGLLAYSLGYAAATLAASNARQSTMRADQAELLLAQTQRAHEEQVQIARLQESTRIAREIHDVLAHSLAGLTIALEATASRIEQGAENEEILMRVRRAHELARDGLSETRRAVGALRGDDPPRSVPVAGGIEALVAEYRSASDARVTVTVDGELAPLAGEAAQTLVRAVQESLTNVSKHAPRAPVTIALHASGRSGPVTLRVVNGPPPGGGPDPGLSTSGGGYGLRGMRERAEGLGGSFAAGPTDDGGWQVRIEIPVPNAVAVSGG